MINLKLRRCLSEPIRVSKSFVPDSDIALQGDFKTPEDVLNPIIQIQTDVNLSTYNYCEIEEFGRKYFMSAKADSAHIWTISCHVDVLSTYSAGIRNSDALIKRTATEDKINYYINDGTFYTEQRQIITHHTFKRDGVNATMGNDSYYLLVAGG